MLLCERVKILQRCVWFDGHRVTNYPGFIFFHRAHFAGLLLYRHILVHDADAALLSDCNGKSRFGDGVHSGGYERNIKQDVFGQLRFQRHMGWENVGKSRQQ